MKRNRILLVEDESSIRMALEDDLEFEGYEVDSATTGTDGLRRGREASHDLIILDIMLPGLSGFDVCQKLREEGVVTPIIMLSAKGQEIDKVRGLEYGADDYVSKPFSSRELHARIRAVLRRYSPQNDSSVSPPRKFHYGPLKVDFEAHEVEFDGDPVAITPIEFSLLKYFIQNAEVALSRDRILDEVWGDDVHVTPRTVDTHVANLRKKLERDDRTQYIHGIRGVGYKFKPVQS